MIEFELAFDPETHDFFTIQGIMVLLYQPPRGACRVAWCGATGAANFRQTGGRGEFPQNRPNRYGRGGGAGRRSAASSAAGRDPTRTGRGEKQKARQEEDARKRELAQ